MCRHYVEINCQVRDQTVFILGNIAPSYMGVECSGGKDRGP